MCKPTPISYCPQCGWSQPGGWISVKERLPEEGELLLLYTNTNKYDFGVYYDGKWHVTCHLREIYSVTHWMPLPKSPKVKA